MSSMQPIQKHHAFFDQHQTAPRAHDRPFEQKVQETVKKPFNFFASLERTMGKLGGKLLLNIAQSLYKSDLSKAEGAAKLFLREHISDIDFFEAAFSNELDGIIAFLMSKGFPVSKSEIGAQAQTKRRQLLTQLVWIIFGNLARQVIKEERCQFTCAELAPKMIRFLLQSFGKVFNDHEEGREIDQSLQELFEKILPLDGRIINQIKPLLLNKMHDLFKQVSLFLEKDFIEEMFLKSSSPAKVAERVSDTTQEKEALKQFHSMTKRLGEFVIDAFLDEQEMKNACTEEDIFLSEALAVKLTPLLDRISKDKVVVTVSRVEKVLRILLFKVLELKKVDFGKQEAPELFSASFFQLLFGSTDTPYKSIIERHARFFIEPLHSIFSSGSSFLNDAPHQMEKAKSLLEAGVHHPKSLMAWTDKLAEFFLRQVESHFMPDDEQAKKKFCALFSIFNGPFEMSIRAFVLSAFVRSAINPDQKVESEEVLQKILERFTAFFVGDIKSAFHEIKQGFKEYSIEKRYQKALSLTGPLIKKALNLFIAEDLLAWNPLPAWAVHKSFDSLNHFFASHMIQAVQYSIDHPGEPELADALFLIQIESEKAAHEVAESKDCIESKVAFAKPLIALLDQLIAGFLKRLMRHFFSLPQREQEEWLTRFYQPLRSVMDSFLWRFISRLIPKPIEGSLYPLSELVPLTFARLEAIASRDLSPFLSFMKAEWAVLSKEEGLKRIQEGISPIIQRWIEKIGIEIPLPGIYRKMALDQLNRFLSLQIERYLNSSLDQKSELPIIYFFYQASREFLPLEIQEICDAHFTGSKEESYVIVNSKNRVREWVLNSEDFISWIDQLLNQGSKSALEKVCSFVAEANQLEGCLPLLLPLQNGLELYVKGWLWRIFVHLIPAPPDGKIYQADEVLPAVLDGLIRFAIEQKDVREAAKLLKALLKKFSIDDLSKEIPLPDPFKRLLVAKIEKKLNMLLSAVLIEIGGWHDQRNQYIAKANELFKAKGERGERTSPVVKACHAAGKIVEAAIPYLFRCHQDQLSALIGTNRFNSLLDHVGNVRSSEMKALMHFIQVNVEGALLKWTCKMGEEVQKLDSAVGEEDESALEKALSLILNEVEPHLKVYGNGKRPFRKIDPHQMRELFVQEGLLHQGMESEKGRSVVFEKWSEQLLSLAGLKKGENLPLVAWQILQTRLLPTFFLKAFEKMQDEKLFDQLMLIGLEKQNQDWSLDKQPIGYIREAFFPKATADFKARKPVIRIFNDPYQQKLETMIGRLGQLALRLSAFPFMDSIMRKPRIQATIGQTIGQPLRKKLRSRGINPDSPPEIVRMIEVFGKIMEAGVDHLVPCEMTEAGWIYFAFDDNGKRNQFPLNQPNFSMLFPKDDAEMTKAEKYEAHRRKVLKEEVSKGVSRVIRDQLNLQLQSFANLPWDRLVDQFVKMIRVVFSTKHKDKAESAVRKFFWFIRRYVVYPVLAFITLPIWLPVREVVGKILTRKSKRQIEEMKESIHFNLFYRVMDELLKALNGEKQNDQTSPASPTAAG